MPLLASVPTGGNWSLPKPATRPFKIPRRWSRRPDTRTVLFVHDDAIFSRPAINLLQAVGHRVIPFSDPMQGYDAIHELEDSDTAPDLLITRVQFENGMIHGITLARAARYVVPSLRVLFVALPQYADDARKFGEFLELPVPLVRFAAAVSRLVPV